MSIEDDIAQALVGTGLLQYPGDRHSLTAAVMPLVKRARAEALREAADEIEATFADPDRRRPKNPKAEVPTDYVNDPEWAELIVRNRADQVENEGERA